MYILLQSAVSATSVQLHNSGMHVLNDPQAFDLKFSALSMSGSALTVSACIKGVSQVYF